jgi:hypothetical protein
MDVFPHLNINVKDESAFDAISSETLPLHRPIYAMKTEKGPINVPVWCNNYAKAVSIFGEKTFDNTNLEYFSRSSVFLYNTFPYNGAFITRIGNNDGTGTKLMAKASYVLECNIPTSGSVDYTYTYRKLEVGESIANIQATNSGNTVPVMAFDVTNEGKYGNDLGFRLWNNTSDIEAAYDRINSSKSSFLELGFVQKDYGFSTFSFVKTKYSPYSFEFATIDGTVEDGINVDFENMFGRYFDASYVSPVNAHFYPAYVKEIQDDMYSKFFDDSILSVKKELGGAEILQTPADPWHSISNPIVGYEEDDTKAYKINILNGKIIVKSEDPTSYNEVALGDFDEENPNDVDAFNIVDAFEHTGNVTETVSKNLFTPHAPSPQIDDVVTFGNAETTTINTVEVDGSNILLTWDAPVGTTGEIDGTSVDIVIALNGGANVTMTVANIAETGCTVDVPGDVSQFTATEVSPDIGMELLIDGTQVFVTDVIDNAGTYEISWAEDVLITYSGYAEIVLGDNLDYGFNTPAIVREAGMSEFVSSTPDYLTDGSDGDTDIDGASLDDDTGGPLGTNRIEALIEKFYDRTFNPQIEDKAKFPFNTIIDTGYSVALKDELIAFLSFRDDIKIVMSTWSGSDQDEAMSIATGDMLTAKIVLNPESELFGTGACRGSIFGQYGVLNGEYYKKDVPHTIWYAIKIAEYHNLTYIKQQPNGLPYSEVDQFRELSWFPYDKPTKRSLWGNNVNYCQYYDMTHLHFPGLKSVYANDTSVLALDSFVNTIIYIKQLTLPVWAKYAGVDDVNVQATYAMVINDLEQKLGHMLAGRYGFEVSMYQTEEEAQLGFVHHVQIILTGGPAQRVWNLDIICRRTGFEG